MGLWWRRRVSNSGLATSISVRSTTTKPIYATECVASSGTGGAGINTRMKITCSGCDTEFHKADKEYNRQIRHGRTEFYCNRRCFAKTKGRLNLTEGNRSASHMQLMGKRSQEVLTKYHGEDRVFYEVIRRARNRRHTNDMTVEYLRGLWEAQGQCCALTGIGLVLTGTDPVVRASLDRIDSKLGYVEGNVQFVSCSINWAKNSGTNEDVHRLVRLIVEASNPSSRYRRRD